MADQPQTPASEMPPLEIENYQDYAGALRTIASARSLFLVLLVLALFVNAGAYTLIRFSPDLFGLSSAAERANQPVVVGLAGETKAAPPAEGTKARPTEATKAGADEEPGGANSAARPAMVKEGEDLALGADLPDGAAVVRTGEARRALEMILPLAAFVGLACTILLLGCYLLSVNVALSGRLGGVRGSLAAFLWMGVVLLLTVPWARWTEGGALPIPGVYLSADELMNLPTEFGDVAARIIHYVRYLGYPVLIFLVVVAGDRRYTKGYRLAHRQIEARLAGRRI